MSSRIFKSHRSKRVVSVCTTCKAKKLKCDKKRPSCSRCLKSHKECSYNTTVQNYKTLTPPEDVLSVNIFKSPNSASSSSTSSKYEDSINSAAETNRINPTQLMPQVNPDLSQYTSDAPIFNKSVKLPNQNSNIPSEGTAVGTLPLHLWDVNNLIVSYGSTTYFDFPLGSHGIIQYDPYTKLFCGSLHGSTLYELQSRLTFISSDCNEQKSDTHTKKKLGPLHFLENAIIKWVEKTNEYVKNQLPLDYFNTVYTIEDTMHPNLLAAIQMIVREIEIIMIDKKQINYYLKNFYENIYPFYPLIDIPLFESKLKDILVENQSDHYEFNVFRQNIRIKLETLVSFLLILSISLRSTLIQKERKKTEEHESKSKSNKKNIGDIATHLIVFAQKLLSLLNGFKFTNENILCCTLYLFLAEYLHPDSRSIHSTHDDVLTLNCLNNLAVTLGLYNDYGEFIRFKNNPNFDNRTTIFKRKLWISLQSIKMQVCTLDGSFNEMDLKYLRIFKAEHKNIPALLQDRVKESSLFDFKLFGIQDDIYQFHIALGELMLLISPNNEKHDLQKITDSTHYLSSVLNGKFSINNLTTISENANRIREEKWRNADMNLDAVRNFYIIHTNIIGLSSIMGVHSLLSFYFEQRCSVLKENQIELEFYQFFMKKTFKNFLDLTQIINNYMEGHYKDFILEEHEYCLNKIIIFTLIKIWRALMSFSLRFNYRKDQLINKNKGAMDTTTEEANRVQLYLLDKLLFKLKDVLVRTVNLGSKKFEENYIGAYQALQMCKYLVYLMEEGYLTVSVNKFWNKIFNSSSIPERIVEKINTKWGVGPKTEDIIKEYLSNDSVLKHINETLLRHIEIIINGSQIIPAEYDSPSPKMATTRSNNLSNIDNENFLDQFLEANFDLFSNVLNDYMGELSTL